MLHHKKNLKLPAKFSSFGGVWRYDEPQKGRYRFFHQWNIETFGNLNVEHDAELIEFTSLFLPISDSKTSVLISIIEN